MIWKWRRLLILKQLEREGRYSLSLPLLTMSEGESAPHEHYLYNVDERVLCFHGPLIYEAKASDKKGCYRQVHVDSNDLDLEP